MKRAIMVYRQGHVRTRRKARMVEVVGTIGSCRDQHESVQAMQSGRPNEIVMVAGYCHASMETYIRPVSMCILPSPPITRLLEAEVVGISGQFVEAPAGLPGLSERMQAARAMVAAVGQGDEAAYLTLRRPDLADDMDRWAKRSPPDWLKDDQRDVHRWFVRNAALRQRFGGLQAEDLKSAHVLVNAGDLARSGGEDGAPDALVVCWCTKANCRGLWPVAASDADNLPQRPYLCVETNGYIMGPANRSRAIQVSVPAAREGLAEPRS